MDSHALLESVKIRIRGLLVTNAYLLAINMANEASLLLIIPVSSDKNIRIPAPSLVIEPSVLNQVPIYLYNLLNYLEHNTQFISIQIAQSSTSQKFHHTFESMSQKFVLSEAFHPHILQPK